MTDDELGTLVSQPPVRRDEPTWLAVKDYLRRRLRELVSGAVQFGPYWIDNASDRRGSFGCRIRSRTGLPFVPGSDAWEASFCTTGNEQKSWTDVFAFPMRHGRVVRPGGTFWGLYYESGKWHRRGWCWPDGPGEWEWVKRIGDCYDFPRNVCEMVRRPRSAARRSWPSGRSTGSSAITCASRPEPFACRCTTFGARVRRANGAAKRSSRSPHPTDPRSAYRCARRPAPCRANSPSTNSPFAAVGFRASTR